MKYSGIYWVAVLAMGLWACGSGGTQENSQDINEINGNGSYTCEQCHTNKQLLKASLQKEPTHHKPKGGGGCGGSVSRFSGTDPIYVEPDFLNTVHGKLGCQNCHGGVSPAQDRNEAHSKEFHVKVDPKKVCGGCHKDIANNFFHNLHTKFNGMKPENPEFIKRAVVHEMRVSDDEESKKLLARGIEDGGCAECHRATCGSCHITLPEPSGGGFPATGHAFYKRPNDVYNCTACHGSRKGKEYMLSGVSTKQVQQSDVIKALGLKDYKPKRDVHYQKGMHCSDCHNASWIHSSGPDLAGSLRYNDPKLPTCQECHVKGKEDDFYSISMHATHAKPDASTPYLQCQVCHAQVYPNCLSCHVSKENKGEEPPPDFKFFTLKIAKNPLKLDFYKKIFPDMLKTRQYDYTLVRRPSVVPDTFDSYRPQGDTVLGNYTEYPTWKYASPHSIVKDSPQTKNGCTGCHASGDFKKLNPNAKALFLTSDFLKELFNNRLGKVKGGPGEEKATEYLKKELEANKPILMDDFFSKKEAK